MRWVKRRISRERPLPVASTTWLCWSAVCLPKKSDLQVGGPVFSPMAKQLATMGEILSLSLRFSGGEPWNCVLDPAFV